MSITAQEGILSFGPQSGREVPATEFYRHRAVNIDLGVNDDVRLGLPEVGGLAIPTFPYKAGVTIGGGATLQPRLKDTLGWLLYGALGDLDTTEYPGASGVYNHVFKLGSTPYMTFRKYIPPSDGTNATDLGEIYEDCKIIGLSINMPTDAPLTSRMDVLGRGFTLDDAPDLWTYENTFESWESIPVPCMTAGYIKVGGETLGVVAATVTWQNVPLDIRQERVFGNPFIEDVTPVQHVLGFDLTVKWRNPDLYRQVLTSSDVGTSWSGAPFVGALDIKAVSSVNMPTENEPYSLGIVADQVMMTQVGGITLAGNQSVMLRFNGTAIEGDGEYAEITLRNKVDSYVWPTGS